MDEKQQYLSGLSYADEQEANVDINVIEMMRLGVEPEYIEENYSLYSLQKTPTFTTSPKDNKSLSDFMSVAEVLKNPKLREQPAYEKLYKDYIDYKINKSYDDSSLVMNAANRLGKAFRGVGMIQLADSPFKTRYNDLDPDSQKAIDWLDALSGEKDPETKSMLNKVDTAYMIGGIVADTVALQGLIGGDAATIAKAVRTGNAAKANSLIGKTVANAFIKKTSVDGANLTKVFLTGAKITGQLAEDLAIGSAFTVRDILLNEDLKDMSKKEQVQQLAKEFGVGVSADLIVNSLTHIGLPFVINIGRVFLTPNAGSLFKRGSINSISEATEVALDALQGKVDPNLIKNLRREGMYTAADTIEEIQGEIINIKTLKTMGLNEDATMKVIAMSSNMKLDKVDDVYEVVLDTLAKKKVVKKVATLEEVANLIDTKHLKGLKRTNLDKAKLASLNKELKIQQKFEGTIQSGKASIDLAEFSSAVIPKSGAFNAGTKGGALKFTKTAIKELGAGTVEGLDKLSVKLADNFFKAIPSIKSDILELPRQIKTGQELRQYTKYLGDFITHHGTEIDKKALDEVLTSLGDITGSWSLRDMDWITAQAKNLDVSITNKDGLFYVDSGLGVRTFESEELLGNHIFAKTITEANYEDFLQVEKGFTMVKDPDFGIAVLDAAKSKVAVGETIEDIMSNNSMLRPKYPMSTGPKISFIGDSTRQVEFNGQYIEGSVEQINKYFENYADTKVMSDLRDMKPSKNVYKSNGTKVLVNIDKRKWVVTADSFGMSPKTFRSEKELKKFLATIDTPQRAMRKTAGQKGVNVIATKAGFVVQKIDKPDQVFRSFEDTANYIKRLPNKPITPEVMLKEEHNIKMAQELYGDVFKDVNLDNISDDQNIAAIRKTMSDQYETRLTKMGKNRLPEGLREVFGRFRNNRSRINSMLKGNVDNIPLATAYDNVLEVEKQMKTIQAKFGGAMLSLNKLVPKKDRLELGELLSKELPEELWESAFKNMTGTDITPKQVEFLQGVRSMFDQAGKLNGFGDSLDTIENYFTRMKTLDAMDIFSKDTSAVQLAEKAYGRKLYPAETKFFQNMRTVDLAGYAYETDPLALLDRYVSDTLKSNLLEPAIDTFQKTGEALLSDSSDLTAINKMAKHARGMNDDSITESMKKWNDEVNLKYYQKVANGYAKAAASSKKTFKAKAFLQGKASGLSEEAIANMSPVEQQVFAEAISKHNFRQNPLNKLMGMVTLSTQAGKGWLPIRNTFQPETHLAPIFGFDAVMKAREDVSKLSKEAYEFLARKGIFQAKSIQSQVGTTGEGIVKKANELGLLAFKGSDDFDRAVGFMTVRNTLADALEASTEWGGKSATYFGQQTKLYAAPQGVRDGVFDAISKGDLDDATTIYAQWINDMTFLNYSSIDRPEAFNSFIGKMFGQMGTFSTQTLSSRMYFAQNLTKTDLAIYTGRVVLGGLALNSAFSEVTGSEVTNFSCYKSMIFAGGPLMETVISARDIASGTDYKVGRGLSSIKNQATNLFTPLGTATNMYEGIQRIGEGEAFMGAQQFLGAPGKGQEYGTDREGILKLAGRL